eukprot:tig00000523_g1855.t1
MRAVERLAAHGSGSTLVVEGDPGFGKSRLLRELERACTGRGVLVLNSTAGAVEESTPLWALRGILSSVADTSAMEALRSSLQARCRVSPDDVELLWTNLFGLSGSQSQVTKRLVKDKAEVQAAEASGDHEDSSFKRRRHSYQSMHGSITTSRGPLQNTFKFNDASAYASKSTRRLFGVGLIVHISSAFSREVDVEYLNPSSNDQSVTQSHSVEGAGPEVIAHARTPSKARDGSRRTIALQLPPLKAPTHGQVTLLKLEPLSEAAAHALLTSLSDHMSLSWPDGAVELVLSKAAGVPLFLVELCRQQAAGGGVALGSNPDHGAFQVPDTLTTRTRTAQAVLKIMSVIGANFTCEAVLAADPSGLDAATVHASFRQLCRAQLIGAATSRLSSASASSGSGLGHEPAPEGNAGNPNEPEGPASGSASAVGWPAPGKPFVFLHALVRDAVYGTMSSAMKRGVHRRLAVWTEAQASAGAQGYVYDPAVLMVHWREAGEPMRFAECLEGAARQANHKNALLEAKRLFGELVATIDALGLAGPHSAPLPAALHPSNSTAAVVASAWKSRTENGATGAGDSAHGDREKPDHERWRATRSVALRHWAYAEFFSGNDACASALAVACIEGLGERLPQKPASAFDTIQVCHF